MKQLSRRVGSSRNGSSTAVVGSGISSMSDSWMAWNPRIDEPSNPKPSAKLSSVSSLTGIEKCCMRPGRSQKRRSTILTPLSLASARTSLGVSAMSTSCQNGRVHRRVKAPGVGKITCLHRSLQWPASLAPRRAVARVKRPVACLIADPHAPQTRQTGPEGPVWGRGGWLQRCIRSG